MSRRLIAVLTIVAGSVFGLAGAVGAGPAPPPGHCVTPDGTDLNVAFRTEQPIVTGFCTTIPDRLPWRAVTGWVTAPTHEVIPPGYVPTAVKPIDDFAKKFVRARYVIDRGTPRARTFEFDVKQLRLDRPPDLFGWASEPLRALQEGTHVVELHIFLWADHWDGLGLDPAFNRLPKGWSLFERITFTVE